MPPTGSPSIGAGRVQAGRQWPQKRGASARATRKTGPVLQGPYGGSRCWTDDLGLVPKQISTGDRTILGGISRRGNRYLRTLFIQGARSVLQRSDGWEKKSFGRWLIAASKRLHKNVLAAALANKLARIAWAVLYNAREHDTALVTVVTAKQKVIEIPPRFARGRRRWNNALAAQLKPGPAHGLRDLGSNEERCARIPMMAGGASSNQRPDRLMRTACPSEDSTCNARPVHRCAGARRNPCPSPAHAQNEVRAPERCCARSIAFGTACISSTNLLSELQVAQRASRARVRC